MAAGEFLDCECRRRAHDRHPDFDEDFVGGQDVVMASMNSSGTAIVRSPFGPRATTLASSARSTIGISAAGSALAIDPPIVPRERVGR